ncbi:helix-turn-helix transcriptional regulator [Actinocorallia longicatena]
MRLLRERRGMNLAEAADLLSKSKAALGKFENGQVALKPSEVDYILLKYEMYDAAERGPYLRLSERGRAKGWWLEYKEVVDGKGADFLSIESEAGRIDIFSTMVVPGLMQTPAYAAAMMGGSTPEEAEREPDLQTKVAFRMERQRILHGDSATRLHVVISEAVIRQKFGGESVWREQMQALLTVSRMENVSLQIMPFAAETHPGMSGAFIVFDALEGDFSVVLVESRSFSTFLDDLDQVALYNSMFEELKRLALSPEATRELIDDALHPSASDG